MSEKVSKILNQIKKELEGIKNELKKSNVLKDKRYKEMMKWKKKWKKTHTKRKNRQMLDFFVENWSQILIAVLIFIAWADFSYKLDKIEKNTRTK